MIQVGDTFPMQNKLKKVTGHTVEDFSLNELSKGKIVIFAVPGAFTPTCSNDHLPSFINALSNLKKEGVEKVYCLAVNDHFVLQAWGDKNGVGEDISFLADFDAAVTNSLGMSLDASGAGLGIRSKRYSMLLEDGIVKKLHVEDNPGVCTVTRGDNF